MIFQHHRFQIWNVTQHPFKHSPDEFLYTHEALPPGITSLSGTLDYLIAVLYPQSKPAVADVASLPLLGNTINDMRVVQDDGDGNAASYRWEQREGDVAAKWYKIYDVDWGTDSVLQAWEIKTQDTYVFRLGYDDTDDTGAVIAGDLAGQSVYGGKSANTNLTLFANSGDGVGPSTGFIQVGDQVRPLVDNTIDLGETLRRFKKIWANEYQAGTLVIADGSITDSDGTISFGTTTVELDTLVLSAGSITDTSGDINFGATNLTTTGIVTADYVSATSTASEFCSGTNIGTLIFTDGSIQDTSGDISLGSCNLTTDGNITATIGTVTAVTFETASLSTTGSDITSTAIINIDAGVLSIDLQSKLNGTDAYFTTDVEANDIYANNSFIVGDLTISTGSVTTTSGDLSLLPQSNIVVIDGILKPNVTDTFSLGTLLNRFTDIHFSGDLNNATQTITNSTLFSLRDINVGVAPGMSLFWDGSVWSPSFPDTEIAHSSIDGLTTTDAGHTQFVMLAGRAGGQTVQGGTAASENLTLESTSHATKGFVYFKDNLLPFTDASYAGGWSGTDIGSASKRIKDVYSVGVFKGFRLENFAVNPGASSQKTGRLIWNTADSRVYVDTGATLIEVGGSVRYEEDLVFDGVQLSYLVTVTTPGMDTQKALWQLKDADNQYEIIYAKLTSSLPNRVLISTNIPLPAGNYRIIGIQ